MNDTLGDVRVVDVTVCHITSLDVRINVVAVTIVGVDVVVIVRHGTSVDVGIDVVTRAVVIVCVDIVA